MIWKWRFIIELVWYWYEMDSCDWLISCITDKHILWFTLICDHLMYNRINSVLLIREYNIHFNVCQFEYCFDVCKYCLCQRFSLIVILIAMKLLLLPSVKQVVLSQWVVVRTIFLVHKLELMELENIVANTVYLKAREGNCNCVSFAIQLPSINRIKWIEKFLTLSSICYDWYHINNIFMVLILFV